MKAKKAKQKKVSSVFLPAHVVPEKYVLTIQPDLESATYTGHEVIQLALGKAEKAVTLHAVGLEVVSAQFTYGKKEQWASAIRYNQKAETATFHFPKTLPKGKGKLILDFRGVLNDKLRGYYRSSYVHEGKDSYLATTQFEPVDARRAFPCFDEPNKKAVFQVTVVVPTHHEVVSNTLPALVREHEGGLKAVSFKPTPKMSTYLLAFISGEFETMQKKTRSGVLVRVFTTPGKIKQAQFALGVAVRAVDFFEKYFGIAYPLPALDLLAIPDFSAGAMENWGAITFRETAMLVDERTSALSNKQWVALVVAHEVAHQWFGNLVTMDWWTHLWLNEGFASYMEYVAIDHIFPEWSIWNQFMTLEYTRGVAKDQLASSHPIEVAVHHPSEIDEIFDDISYRKGSSIIRMLAAYVGEKSFTQGLSAYLKKHAYKNATTEDLWTALEKASGKPVRTFMGVWTKQTGLPVVRLRTEDGKVVVSQQRFFINSDKAAQSKKTELWPVPITWRLGNKTGELLLASAEAALPLSGFAKLNVDETGFYRTCYTPDQLVLLAKDIRSGKLGPLDRWGVVHNAWVMAEAGLLPTAAVLTLAEQLRGETDYVVFSELLAGLTRVGSLLEGSGYEKRYAQFVQAFCKPAVQRLGWEGRPSESHVDKLLREQVLLVAGMFGDEAVIVRALQEFKKFVRTGSFTADQNLRESVYRIVARVGGLPEFAYMQSRYAGEHSHEERERLTAGLASFVTPRLLDKALAFAFSKHVRAQDFAVFCKEVGLNALGGPVLWAFLKQNWSEVVHRYGGNFLLAKTVMALAPASDASLLRDMEKFFTTHPHPGAERTVTQVLEHIHTAALWRARVIKELQPRFSGKARAK